MVEEPWVFFIAPWEVARVRERTFVPASTLAPVLMHARGATIAPTCVAAFARIAFVALAIPAALAFVAFVFGVLLFVVAALPSWGPAAGISAAAFAPSWVIYVAQ